MKPYETQPLVLDAGTQVGGIPPGMLGWGHGERWGSGWGVPESSHGESIFPMGRVGGARCLVLSPVPGAFLARKGLCGSFGSVCVRSQRCPWRSARLG